jgi:hypothetical protein
VNTSVVFSDATTCDLLTTSDTEITCLVSGFLESSLDIVNPYSVTITVNGVVDTSQTVTILEDKQSGQSVSPSSVSPVLNTILTVTLEDTYPETLTVESFTAILID